MRQRGIATSKTVGGIGLGRRRLNDRNNAYVDGVTRIRSSWWRSPFGTIAEGSAV